MKLLNQQHKTKESILNLKLFPEYAVPIFNIIFSRGIATGQSCLGTFFIMTAKSYSLHRGYDVAWFRLNFIYLYNVYTHPSHFYLILGSLELNVRNIRSK